MNNTIKKSPVELEKGYCESSPYIRDNLIDVSTEGLGTRSSADRRNITEQRRRKYEVIRPLNILLTNFLTTMREVLSKE